ncbi:MAG: lysylphosphatidylglycerol synthase transmembrane domain-containing protein [Elusimicrobiota bacterium]
MTVALKRGSKATLGLAIGAILLYLALRQTHWEQIADAVRQASWRWIAVAVGCQAAALLFKALRLMLLCEGRWHRPKEFAAAIWLGLGANAFIPFRVGEAVKIAYVAKRAEAGFLKAGLTVFAERVLDFICLGLLVLSVFLFKNALFLDWAANFGTYFADKLPLLAIAIACFIVLCVTVLVLWRYDVYHLRTRSQEKIMAGILRFREALPLLMRHFALAFIASLCSWASDMAFLGATAAAFGNATALDFGELIFTQMVLAFSYLPSVTPGALGVFELMGLWAFAMLERPKDAALAVLLTAHGLVYIALFSGMLIAMLRETLTTADKKNKS